MIAQFFSAELAVVIPFVILALIAFAIVALVTARRDPDPYDPAKRETAAAVEAALVALVALGVLWFHVGRLRELAREPEFNRSAGRRTYQVYLHAASFTAAAIFIFGAAAALYAIFRIA